MNISPTDLRSWGACWSDDRIASHYNGRSSLTTREIGEDPSIPSWDRVWVLTHALTLDGLEAFCKWCVGQLDARADAHALALARARARAAALADASALALADASADAFALARTRADAFALARTLASARASAGGALLDASALALADALADAQILNKLIELC